MIDSFQPKRRTEDLTVQHIGAETLVYNERTQTAFCLNRIAAAVWLLADGTRTPQALAAAATLATGTPVSAAIVDLCLSDLRRDGLLAPEPYRIPAEPQTSRRELVARLGIGAAMLLPVIAMVAAPRAAQAYGGTVSSGIKSPIEQQYERYQMQQAEKAQTAEAAERDQDPDDPQ